MEIGRGGRLLRRFRDRPRGVAGRQFRRQDDQADTRPGGRRRRGRERPPRRRLYRQIPSRQSGHRRAERAGSKRHCRLQPDLASGCAGRADVLCRLCLPSGCRSRKEPQREIRSRHVGIRRRGAESWYRAGRRQVGGPAPDQSIRRTGDHGAGRRRASRCAANSRCHPS